MPNAIAGFRSRFVLDDLGTIVKGIVGCFIQLPLSSFVVHMEVWKDIFLSVAFIKIQLETNCS